ncbi:MAG TPA: hypothetical protein VFR23_04655 [Jiangellaceae bacterium]|nr:hypothetical protein [Jiangellaceae bacterium]
MRRLLRRWADKKLRKRNAYLEARCIAYKFAYLREQERRERAEALLREARDA